MYDGISTRSFLVLPGTARALWAGAMDSNCIYFAMIPEKC